MEKQELISLAAEFFKKNPLVTLVTLHDGYPSARIVSDPFIHEGKLYVITGSSSRKIADIKAEPLCSVFGYSEKAYTYCNLRGLGKMVNDKSMREKFWKEELTRYFPKGVEDPEYCFLEIDIRGVEHVDYSKGFDEPVINRELW
ncbi:pyridoxamine 5'-phosphate oxidase family protein [Acidobacteriota bacterium]